MMQVFGPMGMEEMGVDLQELFGNLGGGQQLFVDVEPDGDASGRDQLALLPGRPRELDTMVGEAVA